MPASDALAAAPTRREQRKQEYREKIMDAAIELFRESGIAAVTLEEICELARVSRPTFYSYYASKQELVHALGEKLWLRVASDLTSESLANSATTAQYLKSFFKVVSRQLSDYSSLERELIREIMAGEVKNGKPIDLMQGLIDLFIAVYSEGQKRGDVGNLYPVDFLAEMTIGGINTVMMRWAVEDNYPIERRLRQLADYIPKMLELKR